MDKKDSKLLQELFISAPGTDLEYRTYDAIKEALRNRRQVFETEITAERRQHNLAELRRFPTCFLAKVNEEKAIELFTQVGFFSILLPSTLYDIMSLSIHEAHVKNDVEILKNGLFTKNRLQLGKELASHKSYNHSGWFSNVVDAFADCDLELVKTYFPESAGLADNNTHSFFRVASNLIISMLYSNQDWLKESTILAEKFNAKKGSSKTDVLVVKYLLALSTKDLETASDFLQQIADAYKKTAWLFNFRNPFMKFFGAYVHGLYHIAHYVLSAEQFAAIRVPEHTVFWKEFDDFTKANDFTAGKACMHFTDENESLNQLFLLKLDVG